MNIENQPIDPQVHVGYVVDADRPVLTLTSERKASELVSKHSHLRGQLLFAIRGAMKATTDDGAWLVPPSQALWIPPGVMHEVEMAEAVSLRSIYIDPAYVEELPDECCVVRVSALLKALILEAAAIGNDYQTGTSEARLMLVILDQLKKIERFPLYLPFSAEPRVRRVTDNMIANPADNRTLAEWAPQIGASERTLGRLFVRHLGMSFGAWRRRLRLLESIDRLGNGASVTEVAYELGYGSPSAFIAMFRENLGVPPARFFSDRR
ncbi:MAG: helix-turn-helix transcriptional regulator [Candidatus Thiodiazotropha taylori]|nr:helix-turn-helix transcriptional regulator [Candidatus Thiodiazotropha taylori]